MRRRILAMTMGLGLVVTAMGFTGIYAVFSDRATTGDNTAESGEQARIADLKVATTATSDCSDASYVDDLTTGVIDVADLQPGGGSSQGIVCLKNAGTAPLDVTVTAIDVVETETGCTGDEAAAGDASCGTEEIGDGDLTSALLVTIARLDCETSVTSVGLSPIFTELVATPQSLETFAPDEVACIWLRVQMLTPGQSGTTLEDIQKAQSDKVQWRFAFDGTPS